MVSAATCALASALSASMYIRFRGSIDLSNFAHICPLVGFREEIVEPDEGDQGAEAGAQHLRRRERRSPHQSC